ncbi:MAG: alpha/beta hydrolase [Bacteroidales bacterium]|jgi:pimeloyl-ACP methyl ester carboxylesterase|nr:alpha/beta hydrolase [Bacteroidales bacterium]
MKKKIIYGTFITVGILLLIFLFGPKPSKPVYNTQLPEISADLGKLDCYIAQKEAKYAVKPDNQSRIIWANDTLKQKTEWVLLYLHGFSASWYEGSNLNLDFAARYHCNAYFPRLAEHGLVTEEPLLNMRPDSLWNSAKEALIIARKLGHKVIIMSTSTGGTLALKLASEYPELVQGLILYSPNIEINAPTGIVTKPWGLQISRLIFGGQYRIVNEQFNSKECNYWNCKYRLEAVMYLQQLVETTMTQETFQKVKCPVFLGYYYKNKKEQDQVVRVGAALEMFEQLGTSANQKNKKGFPDAGVHVIANSLFSKDFKNVEWETFRFADNLIK